MKNIFLLTITSIFFSSLKAQTVNLDPAFGSDGSIAFSANLTAEYPHDVTVRPDGKILVTAKAQLNSYIHNYLMQFLPDGTPDSSFAINGIKEFPEDDYLTFTDVAVDSQNRILILALFYNNYLPSFLYRFLPDGSPDLSFGTDGRDTLNLLGGISALMLQPDGKILVTALSIGGFSQVKRFNDDGTPDPTFNVTGSISLNGFINGITLQPDGKIILAGYTDDSDLFVARLLPDGSYDVGFGTNGITLLMYTEKIFGQDAAILPDGKIVITGHSEISSNSDWACWRLLSDGAIDPSFGTNGMLALYSGKLTNEGWFLFPQSDGSFITGGIIYNGLTYDPVLIKVNYDGSVDNNFGNNGITDKTFTSINWIETNGAIGVDSTILLCGSKVDKGNITAALSKFQADGSIDDSFGLNGTASIRIIDTTKSQSSVLDLAELPDGKILNLCYASSDNNMIGLNRMTDTGEIDSSFGENGWWIPDAARNASWYPLLANGGSFLYVLSDFTPQEFNTSTVQSVPDSTPWVVYKLLSDGTIDSTYGNAGSVQPIFVGHQLGKCLSIAAQIDGKLVGCGEFVSGNSTDIYLFRLNSDGLPDPTFGDNGILIYDWTNYNTNPTVALQQDHKIILSADSYLTSSGNAVLKVVRLLEDGSQDISFGDNGTVTISNSNSLGNCSVLIQPDNKILVRASDYYDPTARYLIRISEGGLIDSSFGINGFAAIDPNNAGIRIVDLTLQSDGRILAAGSSINFSSLGKIVVERFLENGEIDSTFGTNGLFYFGDVYFDGSTSITLQQDEKILVGGVHYADFYQAYAVRLITKPSAIEVLNPINQLLVFPNPFSQQLTIQFPGALSGKVEMLIRNIVDQVVMKKELLIMNRTDQLTINMSALLPGTYLINLKTKNSIFSTTVIKN